MKTSNKLLIILAIALFVIPVVGTIIYAKNSRVDGRLYEAAIKKEGEDPNAADQFLVSRKVDNFNKVIIDGENQLYTSVSIIKSDQPLVKFSKGKESSFTTSVDDSGNLHIKKNPENKFSSSSIYVFIPAIDSVVLNKLHVYKFETNFDSINLVGSHLNNGLSFGENKNLKSLNLTIKNSRISIGRSNQVDSYLTNLQNFNLHVINGGVSLTPAAYKVIKLDLQNSNFNFIRERNGDKNSPATVERLILNTSGVSELGLFKEPMKIRKISGSLSDSTITDLPLYIIKDLFYK